MLLKGDAAAAHVLSKIPLDVWKDGQSSVMKRLRLLSAGTLSSWGYEDLLNYIIRAQMDQRNEAFEDQWNPASLLSSAGFNFLENCNVEAVQE